MTIVRGDRSKVPVVVILRAALQDDRLSYRARGVLAAVLSRPDDWRTSYRGLAASGREGERAVLGALRELEHQGYLRRTKVHDGRRITTEWVITDDPAAVPERAFLQPTKVQPTKQRPTRPQPTKVRPTTEQPTEVQPLLERETERDTTPPTPAPDDVDVAVLVGVVVDELEQIGTPRPATRTLRAECRRLAVAGWHPEQLRGAVRDHGWAGAGPGAVVAWLRDLTTPPAASVPKPRRPDWCGSCDQGTRLLIDDNGRPRRGQTCPTCHPDRTEIPA